jgi:hypothetical protein
VKLNGTNVVNVHPIYTAIMQEEKWEKVESKVKETELDINISYVINSNHFIIIDIIRN